MGGGDLISSATGGGGLTSAFSSISDGFQLGDLGALATAAGPMLGPYAPIAGAAAGLLAGGGMEGFSADSITGALGGLGLSEDVMGGITDAATALQEDPSEENMGKFFESLEKIPEEKREEAMKAILEKLPPEVQEKVKQMMEEGGNGSGGTGSGANAIG